MRNMFLLSELGSKCPVALYVFIVSYNALHKTERIGFQSLWVKWREVQTDTLQKTGARINKTQICVPNGGQTHWTEFSRCVFCTISVAFQNQTCFWQFPTKKIQSLADIWQRMRGGPAFLTKVVTLRCKKPPLTDKRLCSLLALCNSCPKQCCAAFYVLVSDLLFSTQKRDILLTLWHIFATKIHTRVQKDTVHTPSEIFQRYSSAMKKDGSVE